MVHHAGPAGAFPSFPPHRWKVYRRRRALRVIRNRKPVALILHAANETLPIDPRCLPVWASRELGGNPTRPKRKNPPGVCRNRRGMEDDQEDHRQATVG